MEISLEEQSRMYAKDRSKTIKGSIRITNEGDRAIIETVAENLRDCSGDRCVYKLFFIGRKDGNSVHRIVGDLYPDVQGRAGFRTAIDVNDADGKGTELSCFYIFLIAAVPVSGSGHPLQSVLKGDIQVRTARKTYNEYYSQFIRDKCLYLIEAENSFDDIIPFDGEWMADNWKIVRDSELLPVASRGAGKQFRKYGHFLYAHKDGILYLALPGRHRDEEWPDRGASGFCLWQPIRGSAEYGYWCMIIEHKSGIITEIS